MRVIIAHYSLGVKVLLTLLFYFVFPLSIFYLTSFFRMGLHWSN